MIFLTMRKASLKRRVKQYVEHQSLDSISDLIPHLARSDKNRRQTINNITVSNSKLFRDPNSFHCLRNQVFPYLASFPRLDIWVAGCAKGEEAFSLAIMLLESGLLARTKIYATDINTEVVAQARSGVLTKKLCREDAIKSGGSNTLSSYFSTAYGKQKLSQNILEHIHFEEHNLNQDKKYRPSHLILCRNVMIYFNLNLQNKVLQRLYDSIINNGYLVIGEKESLDTSPIYSNLTVIDEDSRIYQRKRK